MISDDLAQELYPHPDDLHALAETYRQAEPEHQIAIDLKLEHSLRVLADAAAIADSLALRGEVRRRCLLAALYHDAGRFPQYDRYKTFHDGRSENHARLGVATLKRLGLPRGESLKTRRVALTAVLLHNRRFLPAKLDPETALVTHCVRDADKLDILRVMLDHFTGRHGDIPAVRLHVQNDPEAYSETVYGQVMAGAMGEYAAMRWVNDFKLLLLSWVYGMHNPTALRMMRSRGLVQGIMETLPDNPAMDVLRDKVLSDLDAMVESG